MTDSASDFIKGSLLTLLGAAVGILITIHNLPPVPYLIGHGCMNTNGDIFAMHEDDFPPCEDIEANK